MSRRVCTWYLNKEAPEQLILPQPMPNFGVKEESIGLQLQPQRGVLENDLLEHPDERKELQDWARVIWAIVTAAPTAPTWQQGLSASGSQLIQNTQTGQLMDSERFASLIQGIFCG